MAKKIPLKTAQAEVESWLDFKKVKSQKRENLQDNIDNMVDNIVDGSLILREDMHFVQTLLFPMKYEGKETLKELVYKPRLQLREINVKMKGVKPTDADGRIVGYTRALTDQPAAVITNLDTEDNTLAQHITGFFL